MGQRHRISFAFLMSYTNYTNELASTCKRHADILQFCGIGRQVLSGSAVKNSACMRATRGRYLRRQKLRSCPRVRATTLEIVGRLLNPVYRIRCRRFRLLGDPRVDVLSLSRGIPIGTLWTRRHRMCRHVVPLLPRVRAIACWSQWASPVAFWEYVYVYTTVYVGKIFFKFFFWCKKRMSLSWETRRDGTQTSVMIFC